MTNKTSHTIRFDKKEKEEIAELGRINGRGFQSQVDFMLKEQLKNQRVVMFLEGVRCALEAMNETHRKDAIEMIRKITIEFSSGE